MTNQFLKIEKLLMEAKLRKISNNFLIKEILKYEFLIPNAKNNFLENFEFLPFIYEKNKVEMVGVFTEKGKITIKEKEIKNIISKNLNDFFPIIPQKYGIIINPGDETCMAISPEGIKKIKKDFLL